MVQHRQPVVSCDDAVIDALDHEVVEADLAELVDQHCRVGERFDPSSRRLRRVVLPAPRKPVRTVSGRGGAGFPRGPRAGVIEFRRFRHGPRPRSWASASPRPTWSSFRCGGLASASPGQGFSPLAVSVVDPSGFLAAEVPSGF